MANFNISSFNGETGKFRGGVFFPELLTNDWNNEKMEPIGDAQVKSGIMVGAQRRPLIVADRKIIVPANRGQVAWAGDTSPITKQTDEGKKFAISGSIETIRTDAGGTRFSIVAPAEGEQAATVLVMTGLQGNGREQEAALLDLFAQGKKIYPHGSYAVDDGARGLVRKIRTAMTRRQGTLTRVNHLIELQVGGRVLVAGMLDEDAVWLLTNEGHGRLKIADKGKHLRPQFAQLVEKQRKQKPDADKLDEVPEGAEMPAQAA